MNEVFENIAKGLFVAGQLPLDAKTYFSNLAEVKDLGISNYRAYQYYELMKVDCVETQQRYIWKEVDQSFTGGILDSNFLYPSNTVSNGIVYSGRYFNFVVETAAIPTANIARPYIIFKHPNNLEDYLQVNDVVIGYFSATEFVTMRYKTSGSVINISNWAIINKLNPLTYVN